MIGALFVFIEKRNRLIMESKIPLPTDNVYKFYALFGLLTFIFSIGAILYSTQATNNVLFGLALEAEQLKHPEKPSALDDVKKKLLERKIEIAIADRETFKYSLYGLIALATVMIYYGFSKWHTEIQPRQDEMAAIQLETAKLQLQKLRDEKPVPIQPAETT
jgi:hypothetical protein